MTDIWARVDALVDRSPGLEDLRAHKVHALAARRRRARDLPVTGELADAERAATMVALAAPAVLEDARALSQHPLIVLKGPEIAARYPDPAMRPFADLDLLSAEPNALHEALVGAGYRPVGHDAGHYADAQHLQPLHSPRFPLWIEVHRRPNWLDELRPPPVDDILAHAQPSATAIDGLLAPAPAQHVLLLAAHAWTHEPLGRLLPLVDIALLLRECDRADVERWAHRWGVTRLWRTTAAVVDSVLLSPGDPPWPLRTWARNLVAVRRRTALESRIQRLLAPPYGLPPAAAAKAIGRAVADSVRPAPGEHSNDRLWRARGVLSRVRRGRSEPASSGDRRS